MIDEAEKNRRRKLLAIHLGAENRGDLTGIMETFAPDAVMHYNGAAFPSAQSIGAAHAYLGFSDVRGAFRAPKNVVDRESFTDTDIVVEGRLCGVHQDAFLGFAPTGRAVELPFVAIYQFGADGKLSRERVVMNLGPLNPSYVAAPEGLA